MNTVPRRAATLLLLLAALPARAQPAPEALSYAGYVAGLQAIRVDAALALTPGRYHVQVSFRLTGVTGALFHAQSTTAVEGTFAGDAAQPDSLTSIGSFRGRPRTTRLAWRNGDPAVLQLEPPVEEEREPVPEAEQAHTVDTLSAMAALLRQVATTGRCEGALRTFDGRRLSELRASTVGEETLAQTSRSVFQGTALRCDFEGRQLGGFLRDADRDSLARPQRGSAWFARLVPGGPPVPVRLVFAARPLGQVTMYLATPPPG